MWSLEDRIFFENALGHGPVRKGSRVHERLRVFDFEFFACANLALYAFTSLSFNSIRVGGRRNMVQSVHRTKRQYVSSSARRIFSDVSRNKTRYGSFISLGCHPPKVMLLIVNSGHRSACLPLFRPRTSRVIPT